MRRLLTAAVLALGACVVWARRRPTARVSDAWLRQQALRDTKQGWEGPRWRLPKERGQ